MINDYNKGNNKTTANKPIYWRPTKIKGILHLHNRKIERQNDPDGRKKMRENKIKQINKIYFAQCEAAVAWSIRLAGLTWELIVDSCAR